jgi:AraC family transcriptional regulator
MNMSVVDKALWVVERNPDQALTLNAIAEACGVSRSHLANAFGTASGWPVMKYLRARRLTQAARKLADGAPDILSLALDFGYGSHEAFTRAFRDHFGHTPEQVRRQKSLDGMNITPPLKLSARKAIVPRPVLKSLGRLRLVGLPADCSYDEIISIPAQWQRFMAEHYHGIPHKIEAMPIGVCDVPDDDGSFRYVCAAPVETFNSSNRALVLIEATPRMYAVFAHDGHVSTLFDTYTAVWNEALPAIARRVAESPVLEFHNDAFDPATGLGGLKLWIPLEHV